MRVWQVHTVLCIVAFIASCDRSPDHTTWSTPLPLLLAVRDRIIRAQDSPEPIGNIKSTTAALHAEGMLTPS